MKKKIIIIIILSYSGMLFGEDNDCAQINKSINDLSINCVSEKNCTLFEKGLNQQLLGNCKGSVGNVNETSCRTFKELISARNNSCSSSTNSSSSQTSPPQVDCVNYNPDTTKLAMAINGLSTSVVSWPEIYCNGIMEAFEQHKKCLLEQTRLTPKLDGKNLGYSECLHLLSLSRQKGFSELQSIKIESKSNTTTSPTVGLIFCSRKSPYTVDYDDCKKVLNLVTGVAIAEVAMEAEQKVRTDIKNANIAKDTEAKIKEGDGQSAAYDAAIASKDHQKNLQTEKMLAYSTAVGALGFGLRKIPGEKEAIEMCESGAAQVEGVRQAHYNSRACEGTVKKFSRLVLPNQEVKGLLFRLMTNFISKGVAAGIMMNNLKKEMDVIGEVNENLAAEGNDVMMELCQFNPADPACLKQGQKVKGSSSLATGQNFTIGNGANNNFGVAPEQGQFGEQGNETNISDLGEVAPITSPFRDQAQEAKGILDPAAPAVAQPGGGSAGGGGGGGGVGGGGGGASLGNDIDGKDKGGSSEAELKPGKVSGAYSNVGGGGFKGVGKGREDSNPFSDLFAKKGEAGGVEEDRSIASGDVDGKSIDLFQKISKRYGQIQADKRIETKNLD